MRRCSLSHAALLRARGAAGLGLMFSLLTLGCVQQVEVLTTQRAPNLSVDMRSGVDVGAELSDMAAPEDLADMVDPASLVPDLGPERWVAVGDGLTTVTRDGQTWWDLRFAPEQEKNEGRTRLRSVVYTGSAWVAVGGVDNPLISRSVDGVHWQHDLLKTVLDEQLMALPEGQHHGLSDVLVFNQRLVAVGRNGVTFVSEDDGLSWRCAQESSFNGWLIGLEPHQGKLIAVGNLWGRGDQELGAPDVSDGIILTSLDGESWGDRQEFPDSWFAYGAISNGSFIVTAGWENCWTSADAISWQRCELEQRFPELSGQVLTIQHWRDKLAVIYKSGYGVISADGLDWETPYKDQLFYARAHIDFSQPRLVFTAYDRRGYSADDGVSWAWFDGPLSLSFPVFGRLP